MLKIGTIPVVDESFLKAVKYALDQIGINPDSMPLKKRRTCLDGVGYGGESAYNGYFTIKLRTVGEGDDATQNIIVCDGETYDAEKGTSGVSLASVNGKTYEVDSVEIAVPETNIYIVGEFIPPVYNEDGTELSDSRVEITTCNNVADYENNTENPDPDIVERFVTVIGEVIIKDTGVSIIQRHGAVASGALYNNGKLVIEYYVRCAE